MQAWPKTIELAKIPATKAIGLTIPTLVRQQTQYVQSIQKSQAILKTSKPKSTCKLTYIRESFK